MPGSEATATAACQLGDSRASFELLERTIDQTLHDTHEWICKHGDELQRSLAAEMQA